MPAKPKYTKQALLDAALDIIREDGLEAVTAQELGRRLGASAPSVFTHFATVGDIRRAAVAAARALFDRYAAEGIAMNPPFKGFGLRCVQFAGEEPALYRLLFMRGGGENPLLDYVHADGPLGAVERELTERFGVEPDEASWLFSNMVIYTHGLCCMEACGLVHGTAEEISARLGTMFRRLMIGTAAPPDERTGLVPAAGAVIEGDPRAYAGRAEKTKQGEETC